MASTKSKKRGSTKARGTSGSMTHQRNRQATTGRKRNRGGSVEPFSHDRTLQLARQLMDLDQQQQPDFEVIGQRGNQQLIKDNRWHLRMIPQNMPREDGLVLNYLFSLPEPRRNTIRRMLRIAALYATETGPDAFVPVTSVPATGSKKRNRGYQQIPSRV